MHSDYGFFSKNKLHNIQRHFVYSIQTFVHCFFQNDSSAITIKMLKRTFVRLIYANDSDKQPNQVPDFFLQIHWIWYILYETWMDKIILYIFNEYFEAMNICQCQSIIWVAYGDFWIENPNDRPQQPICRLSCDIKATEITLNSHKYFLDFFSTCFDNNFP